jgi:hypothetical protein
MKKKILTMFAVATMAAANAQDKGFISLNFGTSNPLGAFGNNEAASGNGYAESGGTSVFNVNYYFSDHWGASFTSRSATNRMDITKVLEKVSINGGTLLANSVGNYTPSAYMLGATYRHALGDKTEIIGGASLGLLSLNLPALDLTAISGGNVSKYRRASSDTKTATLGLDATIRYNFARKWCAMSTLGYMIANPKFLDVQENTDGNVSSSSYDITYSAINFTIGIGFRLGSN